MTEEEGQEVRKEMNSNRQERKSKTNDKDEQRN